MARVRFPFRWPVDFDLSFLSDMGIYRFLCECLSLCPEYSVDAQGANAYNGLVIDALNVLKGDKILDIPPSQFERDELRLHASAALDFAETFWSKNGRPVELPLTSAADTLGEEYIIPIYSSKAVLSAIDHDFSTMIQHIISAVSSQARLNAHGDPSGAAIAEQGEALQVLAERITELYAERARRFDGPNIVNRTELSKQLYSEFIEPATERAQQRCADALLQIIRQGAEVWNAFRVEHPEVKIDLRNIAALAGMWLYGFNFSGADFSGAFFGSINCYKSDFRGATLVGVTDHF
jgi:hypothetical protein